MAQAKLKLARKYRSYGSLDPLFVVEDRRFSRGQPAALAHKAQRALHFAAVVLALVAGLDKFTFFITDWTTFVAPALPNFLGISALGITYLAGALEIVLAMGLLLRPRLFGDIFSLWILAITGNLIAQGEHYDVALFNFGLAAGTCALARLSKGRELEEEEILPTRDDLAA